MDGKESPEGGGTLREVRKVSKTHNTGPRKGRRGLRNRSQSCRLGVKEWTLFLGTEERQ